MSNKSHVDRLGRWRRHCSRRRRCRLPIPWQSERTRHGGRRRGREPRASAELCGSRRRASQSRAGSRAARAQATPAPRPQSAPRPAAAPAAPAEECWDEEVTVQLDPKDEHAIAGTAIGAVVGGASARTSAITI